MLKCIIANAYRLMWTNVPMRYIVLAKQIYSIWRNGGDSHVNKCIEGVGWGSKILMLAILLITRSSLEESETVLLLDPINVDEIKIYIYIYTYAYQLPTQALINIFTSGTNIFHYVSKFTLRRFGNYIDLDIHGPLLLT